MVSDWLCASQGSLMYGASCLFRGCVHRYHESTRAGRGKRLIVSLACFRLWRASMSRKQRLNTQTRKATHPSMPWSKHLRCLTISTRSLQMTRKCAAYDCWILRCYLRTPTRIWRRCLTCVRWTSAGFWTVRISIRTLRKY